MHPFGVWVIRVATRLRVPHDRAMTDARIDRPWRRRVSNSALRVLSIADAASDEDDLRRRKRVGVAAGLLTIFAPWLVHAAPMRGVLEFLGCMPAA